MTEIQTNSTWNTDDTDSELTLSSLNSINFEEAFNSSYDEHSGIRESSSSTPNRTPEKLPIFNKLKTLPQCGRSLSPLNRSNLSLLNLSISPINSPIPLDNDAHSNREDDDEDNTADSDDDSTSTSSSTSSSSGEFSLLSASSEYVSLEELNLQIQTFRPSTTPLPNRKLNLETIFEDVFLETPPRNCQSNVNWKSILTKRNYENRMDNVATYVIDQEKYQKHHNENQKDEKQCTEDNVNVNDSLAIADLANVFSHHLDLNQ